MSQAIDHEQEIMNEVEASIIDAEFKILTEQNETAAFHPDTQVGTTGLSYLFQNWSNQ